VHVAFLLRRESEFVVVLLSLLLLPLWGRNSCLFTFIYIPNARSLSKQKELLPGRGELPALDKVNSLENNAIQRSRQCSCQLIICTVYPKSMQKAMISLHREITKTNRITGTGVGHKYTSKQRHEPKTVGVRPLGKWCYSRTRSFMSLFREKVFSQFGYSIFLDF